MIRSRRRTQGEFVLWLFGVSLVVLGAAGFGAELLIQLGPAPVPTERISFPPPFYLSTVLLCGCSVALHLAVQFVRREKQTPFRRGLLVALLLGTLFVAVQGYGLWWLVQGQNPDEIETGVLGFVFVFAALHALHVTVALMVLIFVTLRAHDDRYDHEYLWGPVVCAWFWHALGVVWLAILGVFAIATR